MSAYDNKYWSHRIAQLAEKVPETDDLSFFASEAYRDFTEQGVKDLICGTCTYLRTLGYDITKEQEEERINDMVVMMSTDENMTACTNGDSMIIGVNNSLVKYFPNRELRHYAIQGLRVHETAHVLFTDFKTIDMWLGALRNGNWWPVVPDHAQDPDGAELTQVLSKKEFSKSFAAIAGRLENAIEDGFIEREIKEMYKGLATTELCTTNDAMLSMASTFGEFLKAGRSAYSAMFQQVLMYAKYDITMVDDMFSLIDDGHIKVDEKGNIKADEDSGLATIELINLYNMMVPVYLSFRNLSEAYKEEIQSSLSDSLFGNAKNSDSEKLMKKIEELEKMLDKAKADAARAIEAENTAEQKLIQSKKRENALTSKLETAYKEIDELIERIPEPEEAEVVCEAEEERQEPVQQVQAKDYAAALDALLKQHTVVIVGGNENLMKKFQVAHPDASLVAKDMLGTCDQQIQNADIVMFKVDSCSHALYNKGKTICNRYDVPFCYIPNVASISRIEQSMCEQLEEIFS